MHDIHPKILFKLKSIIWLNYLNLSLQSRVIHEDWTNANVTPIFKKGLKVDVRNHIDLSV